MTPRAKARATNRVIPNGLPSSRPRRAPSVTRAKPPSPRAPRGREKAKPHDARPPGLERVLELGQRLCAGRCRSPGVEPHLMPRSVRRVRRQPALSASVSCGGERTASASSRLPRRVHARGVPEYQSSRPRRGTPRAGRRRAAVGERGADQPVTQERQAELRSCRKTASQNGAEVVTMASAGGNT